MPCSVRRFTDLEGQKVGMLIGRADRPFQFRADSVVGRFGLLEGWRVISRVCYAICIVFARNPLTLNKVGRLGVIGLYGCCLADAMIDTYKPTFQIVTGHRIYNSYNP